jgi:protein O-mannosyl-transferase
MKPRIDRNRIFLFYLALTFILYLPTLPGEFYFDDGFFIENEFITDISKLPKLFEGGQTISPMRGISTTSFAITYSIFGWSPLAFRSVNIFLHFINSCLIWTIVLELLSRTRKTSENSSPKSANDHWIAFFTGAIFISHPALTSGVAYIFQRNGQLSTLFYLTTFIFFLKGFPKNKSPKLIWIWVSAFTYILSAWSKEIGITFIAVAIWFELTLQPKENRLQRIKYFFPLALACIFSLCLAWLTMVNIPILKRTMYGDWGVWANVITQWNVLIEYLKIVIWPSLAALSIDHDYPISLNLMDHRAWLSGLILFCFLAFAVVARKKQPLLAFSIGWFFIALIPESTIIPISEVMVEYRLYLPALGWVLTLVLFLNYVALKISNKNSFQLFGFLMLILLSLITWQRNQIMGSEILVWKDAAEKGSLNIRANTAYATFLQKQGDKQKALAFFKKAADLNKMKLPFKQPYPIPHNEWGAYLLEQGKREAAKNQFISALTINPRYLPALENLTRIMEKTPLENYERDYLAVFKKVDLFPIGHYNLGNYYLNKKEYEKAKQELIIAITQDSSFAEAHNNLGTTLGLMGEYKKAEISFLKALEINPKNPEAENNLKKLQLMRSTSEKP